jgi:hypothetical protein
MRGVEKQNSMALTSAMRGVFRTDARTRMEFLDLLHLGTGSLGCNERVIHDGPGHRTDADH